MTSTPDADNWLDLGRDLPVTPDDADALRRAARDVPSWLTLERDALEALLPPDALDRRPIARLEWPPFTLKRSPGFRLQAIVDAASLKRGGRQPPPRAMTATPPISLEARGQAFDRPPYGVGRAAGASGSGNSKDSKPRAGVQRTRVTAGSDGGSTGCT